MSIDRTRLPLVRDGGALHLPRARRHALANGLPGWTVEHDNVPLGSMVRVVRAGASDDPVGSEGLAALAADALDDGAGARDSFALHDAIAGLGASLEIECGADATAIDITTLASTLPEAAGLLADVACRPRFDTSEVERVRDLRRQRIAQMKDVPSAIAERVFVESLFDGHPYGHLSMGRDDSLSTIGVDDVRAFHASRYGVGRSLLIVVGEASHDDMLAAVTPAFAAMLAAPERLVHGRVERLPASQLAGTLLLIDRPGAPQSEIRVGRLGPSRSTPDYFAAIVMNAVLGGQFVSRINLNLREAHGYTYGANSQFVFRRAPGFFVVATGVRTDVTAPALAEIVKELGKIRDGVTAEELSLARDSEVRSLPSGFETSSSVTTSSTNLFLFGLPLDYYVNAQARYSALTAEQVNAAARKYIAPEKTLFIVVGDRAKIGAELEKLNLGPIEVWNADGTKAGN